MGDASGTAKDSPREPSDPFGRTCPLCGDSKWIRALGGRDRLHGFPGRFSVLRCRACGMMVTHPVPGNLADYYPADYAPYSLGWGMLGRFKAILMQRFVIRAAGKSEGLRILDVGCGNGLLLAKLNRPGWVLHGLEPDAGCVERVRRGLGIDVRRGVLGDRCFEPGFDVITMFHVLEHVPDPRADLAEVHRLLRPGGVFIVEVPSCDGYGFALARDRWFGLDLPRHLIHFSARTLSLLLEKSGFRIRGIRRRPMPSMDWSLIDWKLAGHPLLDTAWYVPSWFLQKMFRGDVVRMVAFRD